MFQADAQKSICNGLLKPCLLAVASHQSRVQALVVTESRLLGKSPYVYLLVLHASSIDSHCSSYDDGSRHTVSHDSMILHFGPCLTSATCRSAGGSSKQCSSAEMPESQFEGRFAIQSNGSANSSRRGQGKVSTCPDVQQNLVVTANEKTTVVDKTAC